MQYSPDIQFIMRSEDCLKVWKKYKLDQSMSLGELEQLWKNLLQIIRPAIWYTIEDAQDHVFAAVTLGMAFDEYQGALESDGHLLEAYALDCLGLGALSQMYDLLEMELRSRKLFVRERIFGEPDQILQQLDTTIELMENGMMKPLKTAVMKLLISRDENIRCQKSVCSSCENVNCLYRENQKNKTGVSATLKYSYGYQKIFGK